MFNLNSALLFLSLLCLSKSLIADPGNTKQRNNRPIIGILSQKFDNEASTSYIAASYVKHMESSGARVIPILVEQDENYYRSVVKETNGLLLPGGHVSILHSSFHKAAKILFRIATEANDRGEYYPIYGVCNGFELMTILILDQWARDPSPYLMTHCSAQDLSLNLHFASNPAETRIFRQAESSVIETLRGGNVTPNFHVKCLTLSDYKNSRLAQHLRVVSTTNDSRGVEFVSTFESLNASRPIYLLQWHPEKIVFEFKIIEGEQVSVSHTEDAVKMVQYIGNFIVGESRKNFHRFLNNESEEEALIFNCDPIYTMSTTAGDFLKKDHFDQIYLFENYKDCENPYSFPLALFVSNHYVKIVGMLTAAAGYLVGVVTARWHFCKGGSASGYEKI